MVHFFKCFNCKHEGIVRSKRASMRIKSLSIDAMENSTESIKPLKGDVNCCHNPSIESNDYFVESMPSSLTVYITKNIPQVVFGLNETFDMNSLISSAYPFVKDTFLVRYLMIFLDTGTNCCLLSKTQSEYHEIINDGENINISSTELNKKLNSCSALIIVLERQNYHLDGQLSYCNKQGGTRGHVLMKHYADYIRNHMSVIGGYNITQELLTTVLNTTAWFCDKVLDAYFALLSQKSSATIIAAPAGWFNQVYFDDKNRPRHYRYGKFVSLSTLLFSFERIYFPINVGMHWILVVADLKQKVLFVCDSFAEPYREIVLAIMNFLSQTSLIERRVQLDVRNWKINYFHNRKDFHKQSDSSSCGPYMCIMAKCIEFNLEFAFHSVMARHVIAHELLTNRLCLSSLK